MNTIKTKCSWEKPEESGRPGLLVHGPPYISGFAIHHLGQQGFFCLLNGEEWDDLVGWATALRAGNYVQSASIHLRDPGAPITQLDASMLAERLIEVRSFLEQITKSLARIVEYFSVKKEAPHG